jgi:hypothetical protein
MPEDKKSFDSPDETRTFENGKIELLNLSGGTIGRFTLNPGWQWSKHVKPIAGTEWCQNAHFGYQVSGTMHVVMADGTEFDFRPGEVGVIPPGHDAWVVGNEPVVTIDWTGAKGYAQPS